MSRRQSRSERTWRPTALWDASRWSALSAQIPMTVTACAVKCQPTCNRDVLSLCAAAFAPCTPLTCLSSLASFRTTVQSSASIQVPHSPPTGLSACVSLPAVCAGELPCKAAGECREPLQGASGPGACRTVLRRCQALSEKHNAVQKLVTRVPGGPVHIPPRCSLCSSG